MVGYGESDSIYWIYKNQRKRCLNQEMSDSTKIQS